MVWNCTQEKLYQKFQWANIFFVHLDFARYGGLGSVRRPKCPIREIPRMVLASATFVPQYATRDFQVSFKNIKKLQSANEGSTVWNPVLDQSGPFPRWYGDVNQLPDRIPSSVFLGTVH